MAEKRVQELLGQMQKTLECSICLEMMNNPVSTGCGHQFCRFCLTEFIDRKRQVPCPLCKKPITKRSLMKREELGDMVEGVRSLISAFQKDTGFLFSPPRGPQSGLLPGTPDSIKAKTTTGQKPAKNVVHSNVRRTKRRQLIDTPSTDSPSLIRRGSSPSHSVKSSINGEQDAEIGSSRTLEDVRQQELLKCIQEGTLNAEDSSEDNDDVSINKEGNSTCNKLKTRKRNGSKKHSDRHSSNSNISRQKIGKAESDLTDGGKATMEMNQSKVVSVSDKVTEKSNAKLKIAESIGKSVNEDIAIEVQENNDNDASDQIEMEVDTDVHILSGTSVAKESESSSGPLFRTPVDPKGLKHSHQRNSLEDQSQVRKKSLRSKDNTNKHLEANDHDSCLKMTQEDLTVKVKDNSRTYCKKDKDLFVKEKKATRKVAEWLKNIPPITDSENVGCDEIKMNEPKEKIQPKRMSKKDVKVREEEEAMGNKIKHLAKQVQDNGKGLLFEIDDFETEPEKKPTTDSKIKSEKSYLDNKKYEEVSDVQVQEVKHVITEPVRRKRIFKSRTNQSNVSSESDSDKALIRNNNENVPVMKTITEEKNTSNVLGNEIVEIRSQDSELLPSDPYEFKSSQNTPMKVTKKKGKSKNNKQSKALKSKQVSTKVEDRITKKSFEKVWDKDLIPEKTILKTAKQEEIDKLNAGLMQAEDYDLLTCTQEAAESIANQNSNHKTVAEDRKNVNSDTNAQKKVRFTEPVISDFIQTGKINIIGYRNAKKELDEVKNKKNIKKEEVEAEKGVKIEQKREKDKECPIGSSKDVEDCESDDLSEDYRFQDDSSGTDDLDIEPTQDQFEKPNIEIQPEEIKAKLSQEIDVVQEKVVPETPLIPMNHNPPNTNDIEETPAIFTLPKFNKNLSRPVGKIRKQMKVKTPPLHFKSDTVPETPEIVNIDKHHETHGSVGRKKDDFESEDLVEEQISQENKKDVKDVEQLSKTNSEVRSKILGESDETVSPDIDFTEVKITNTDKVEKVEHMQVDNDVEDLAEKQHQLVDSESSLTQNSESILQTKTVPNKIGSIIDDKNDEAKEAVSKSTKFEGHNKMNMDIEGDNDCSVANIVSLTNTKTKKKRKSFMLDEAEESLDFGSLSACEPTSVSEDSESVSKAKRQRVNRLKRSPKTTGKIQDVQKCQSQEKNSGISSSVEIIPDTMTLQSGNKSFTPIKSSNADKIQEKNDSENIDEDACQVITLSSESGSVASVEEGLKGEGKESNLEKIGTEIEPELRNLGVTETSDVIAETEIGEIENTAELEIKENVNYSIKCTKNMISEKVKVSDYSKSPKTRKKRKSGQLGHSGQDSQSSIDKVRHLSGLLASPQDSLILSGVKGSPEDIFKMDSEMPSVDLSPNGDIVGEDQNSQSLDLGTLIMEEPHSDHVNSVKRKSIDELDLNDKTDNDLINNDNDRIDREKSDSQGLSSEKFVNPCCRNKETEFNINSPSNHVERGGKVSGVRGFAKRKRKSAIGQSPYFSSISENSAIDETPLSYNSVKYKSPVVKFSSPKLAKASQSEIIDTDILNKVGDETKVIHNSPSETSKSKGIKDSRVEAKERNTPVKTFNNINSSKYSPKLLKNKKEKGETNESKFGVEVVELRNDDDDNDECILSPDDLPDIDNDCVKVNKDENVDHIMGHQEHVKITKKSKVSPKLILSSPDKENNVVIKGKTQDTPKRIEDEDEYKTVIPETMSVDDDDDVGAGVDVNSPTKGHDKLTGKTLDIDEEECDYNSRTEKETHANDDVGDVENSISSSSSSEFRIDSSDEKSIENEALNEISKFNEIVQNSLDINTLTDSKDMKNNMITQNKANNGKVLKKQQDIEIDENESFERSRTVMKEGKLKKAQDNLKNIVDKNVVDIENMYSTRLDSSPESCVELDMNEESVPVILESDIDDEVDDSVKDDVECIDDKQDINVNREGETEKERVDEDSDDDSDNEIRIKSGRKRAILSDSSSEEEEEESRHMNYTSSSAFSSQSENLTTQERQSLEKEVERMAREMEAMKEQLRKSKEMNKTKKPDKKYVKIDDSDDEVPVIEASDSENGDEDLFLSPPAINPGDLEPDDEETLDPAAVQASQNHDEAIDQVGESLSLCQGSFTVPESDPSQISQSVLQKPNLSNVSHPVIPESDLSNVSHPVVPELDQSNVSHPVIPESDPSKVTRPVLSDLDTNIIPAPKSDTTRHVGIVVTGLNVKQIQQTKKLAALTSAKFFTKFNDSVTHVIVKPADEDDTVCDRTLKFFQGIARKCWIVNFFWVVDSREVGQLLPEGPYEIQGDTTFNQSHFGPKKSRLSKDDKLFQKFQFSLIGDNTYLSKDSMCDLIETCGGEVMDIVKLSKGKRTQFVISCTDIDDDEEDVQSIVKHAREMYKKHGIVTLTREWILDSLTLYKIQPVQDYLVTDLPNLKLPKM